MLIFFIIWLFFIIYSFTRIDLNLTFYNFNFLNPVFNYLKQLGYYQRPLVTAIFIFLSLVFVFTYLHLIKPKESGPKGPTLWKWIILIGITGILAYPMFSYDLFNYIFNAKMTLIFKANPHIQTAIEFSDPMLRFMRNIHTPAPYAYGWTAISLIPGLAWFLNKFTLSFWNMKTFVALFWLGELAVLKILIQKLFPKQSFRWLIFALSPLVLIETLIMGHNDVVMMLPALLSFWFFLKSKKIIDKNFLYAIFFLILSAGIKYATIILLPFYFLFYLQGSSLKVKKIDLATLFSWTLLAIMFIRPGQLHSWYLIWAFSFSVLSKSRFTLSSIIALTIGALLRYVPYIYYGSWDSPVYFQRNSIWLASLLFVPLIYKKIKVK